MIAILADDFSGAAELAGIAAARGFTAEVQTRFDPSSRAEVIAVDTDTRLKTETEAARVVGEVARHIVAAKPAWIYKKTDSVLRGHVRAEIEAILDATGQSACLLIPANPSKGRVIIDGRYFINGVPLDETLFARDPDQPRSSAVVAELLGRSDRIRIPNISRPDELKPDLDEHTLPAGAADFFTALIGGRTTNVDPVPTSATLLVSGSLAAWDAGRAQEMTARGFVVKTIDEPVSPEIWQTTRHLMLAIGRPTSGRVDDWMQQLAESARRLARACLSHPFRREAQRESCSGKEGADLGGGLCENTLSAAKIKPDAANAWLPQAAADKGEKGGPGQNNLRIAIEGGATAMAFIRLMGWTRFEVIPEGHTGVGTLRPPGGPMLWVKPGSYPWPAGIFGSP